MRITKTLLYILVVFLPVYTMFGEEKSLFDKLSERPLSPEEKRAKDLFTASKYFREHPSRGGPIYCVVVRVEDSTVFFHVGPKTDAPTISENFKLTADGRVWKGVRAGNDRKWVLLDQ